MKNSLCSNLLRVAACSLSAGLILLTGCGLQPAGSGAAQSINMAPVSGKAMGGNAAIGNATVTLYATAANSSISNGIYVGTATPLGTTSTAPGTGYFSFGTVSSCTAGTQVYVTISNGDTGGGANAQELLGSMLGPCGSVAPYTVVNEASTIAMAYAMSSFTSIDGSGNVNITAPAANSSVATSNDVTSGTAAKASGLAHAYANFTNILNAANGTALAVPASNSAGVAPQAQINTLASDLQVCVNSTGGTGGTTNCGKLFAVTPALGGTLPANTFQAALNLARNPYSSSANVAGIFNLLTGIGASAVYSPTLTAAPRDWTLAVSYPVPANPPTGIGFPFTIALDADDNVYVTSPENDPYQPTSTSTATRSSTSACLFGFSSNGTLLPSVTPYSGTPGSGTPGSSSWYCSTASSTPVTNIMTQLAPDAVGNIWVANFGTAASSTNTTLKIANTGTLANAFTNPTVNTGFPTAGIAIDKWNDVFLNVFSSSSGVQNIFAMSAGAGGSASTGTAFQFCTSCGATWAAGTVPTFASAGRTLAFDASQNLWGSSYGGSSGNLGVQSLGGTVVVLPITAQAGANYSTAPAYLSTGVLIKKAINGGSTSSSVGNPGPWGAAADSSGNMWFTSAGAYGGQTLTSGVTLGLTEVIPTVTSGVVTAITPSAPLAVSPSPFTTASGATATATLTSGAVTSITVGNGGTGYNVPPLVTIASSAGTGAAAYATVSGGAVTGIVVTNGGSGYTGTATVTLEATAPKFLEADGNNVLWIADISGIVAYSTTANPTVGAISEAGGFTPCIANGVTTCSYPDTVSTKGIAVDSTGSVWYTTPDLSTAAPNSNRLIQLIGTGSATWPLLATGKPGTMPQ